MEKRLKWLVIISWLLTNRWWKYHEVLRIAGYEFSYFVQEYIILLN